LSHNQQFNGKYSINPKQMLNEPENVCVQVFYVNKLLCCLYSFVAT